MLNDASRNLKPPYLLFLGDADPELGAKTAQGIAHWKPDICVGQLSLPECAVSVGLDEITLEQAKNRDAQSLVIGVASHGGVIAKTWMPSIRAALEMGFDIVSGLHERLSSHVDLVDLATRHRCKLHDVRHADFPIRVGDGEKRTGKRLLTVGTDCAVGKMYTSFALHQTMNAVGLKTHLCTTGQTGIMIAGHGIAIDAVVADFISGAVEMIAPAIPEHQWQVIEGQGSLFHPSFAGVTLGLVHGAQPDAMVLCHNPSRTGMNGAMHYSLPNLADCVDAYERAARLTNPAARVIGVSLNTKEFEEVAAKELIEETETRLSLPCVDPVRTGVDKIVTAIALL